MRPQMLAPPRDRLNLCEPPAVRLLRARVGDLAGKSAPNIGIDKDAIARELEIEKKQLAWLRTHIVP